MLFYFGRGEISNLRTRSQMIDRQADIDIDV